MTGTKVDMNELHQKILTYLKNRSLIKKQVQNNKEEEKKVVNIKEKEVANIKEKEVKVVNIKEEVKSVNIKVVNIKEEIKKQEITEEIIKEYNIIIELANSAQIFLNKHKNIKIKMCTNKPCTRKICNFAHSLSDMKLLPHIELFNKYVLELANDNEKSKTLFTWIYKIFRDTYHLYNSEISCSLPKTYKQILIIINNLLYKCEDKYYILKSIYNTITLDKYYPSNFDQFICILMFINLFGQKHLDCLNSKCTFASNCNHNCKHFGPTLYLCFNCINNKQLKCNLQNDPLCVHFIFPMFENIKPSKPISGMSSEFNIKFLPSYMKQKKSVTQNEVDIYLLDYQKYSYIKKMVCKTLSNNILVNDLTYIGYKYIYYRRNFNDKNQNPMNIFEWLKNQLVLSKLKINKIEDNIKKNEELLENAENDNNIKNIIKYQNKLYTLKTSVLPSYNNQKKNIKCDINILNFLINNSTSNYLIARSICRCVSLELQDFFPIEVVDLFIKEEKFKNSMIPFREILKEFLKLKLLNFHIPIQSILDKEFPPITSDLFDETIIEIQNIISIRRNELKLIAYKKFLNLFDKFNISNMPLFDIKPNIKSYKIQEIQDFLYKGALLHYFPKPHVKENYYKNFIDINITIDDILTCFNSYQYENIEDFITIYKKKDKLSSEIYRFNKIQNKEKENEINLLKDKVEISESTEIVINKTNKEKKQDKKKRAEELMNNINKSNININIIINPLEKELNDIYKNIINLNKIKELDDINLIIGNIKITIKNILYFKIEYISKYFNIINSIIIISKEEIKEIDKNDDDFYTDNWIKKENDVDSCSSESSDDLTNYIENKITKPKQMTFNERKKLVMENRKKLESIQINSKTNKKSNQDLEQNALNELLKKYDVSFITKQMILEEVKKIINDRRTASINKRKELLNKEKLELKKNKKIYKNINPKDAYTIETQLMNKILK